MQNTQKGFIKASLLIIAILIVGLGAYFLGTQIEKSKQTGESFIPSFGEQITNPVVDPVINNVPSAKTEEKLINYEIKEAGVSFSYPVKYGIITRADVYQSFVSGFFLEGYIGKERESSQFSFFSESLNSTSPDSDAGIKINNEKDFSDFKKQGAVTIKNKQGNDFYYVNYNNLKLNCFDGDCSDGYMAVYKFPQVKNNLEYIEFYGDKISEDEFLSILKSVQFN